MEGIWKGNDKQIVWTREVLKLWLVVQNAINLRLIISNQSSAWSVISHQSSRHAFNVILPQLKYVYITHHGGSRNIH